MKSWLGVVSSVLVIASCGGGGGAVSEDHVTFAGLPAADRAAFDAWKSRVVKDCAWQQALPSIAAEFPAPSDEEPPAPRVDLRALSAVTGGKSLVVGQTGKLALLGPAFADLVSGQDTRTSRHTAGGVARVLDVSAVLDGGTCVISLDGEEIFRTELPGQVPVVASYDPEAPAPASVRLPALIDGRAGGDDVASLDTVGLLTPVMAALAPNARVHGLLAATLATDEETARRVFPLATPRTADVVRLPTQPAATPFAPGARVFGAKASLSTIFAGGALPLELLFADLDPDLVALRAELTVAAGGQVVTLHAITAAPSVALDDAAARACFLARGVARRFEPEAARSPAFNEQFGGCRSLARSGIAALARDATTRQLVATTAIAPGLTPFAYRGWDTALISIAQQLAVEGVALSALDPDAALPPLTTAIARQAALRAAPADATIASGLDARLIELTFDWMFRGVSPSGTLLEDLVTALRNAAAAYPQSVDAMLSDLASSVDALDDGARAVQCGVGLAGARRDGVDRAVAAVAAVPHVGAYASELRGGVLQRCPSAAVLAALVASAAATTTFIVADEARASGSATFAFDAEPVVDRALDESWTAATFAALADLLDFALISDSTFCATRRSRSEQAECVDPGRTLFTAAGDGILAPAVAARYATMARELTARWPTLDAPRFFGTRFDVTEAWSSGLWRACTDDGFARSKQALFTLLERLRTVADADRFDLEQEIADLVAATTCG
jgi:hypothetical protein